MKQSMTLMASHASYKCDCFFSFYLIFCDQNISLHG